MCLALFQKVRFLLQSVSTLIKNMNKDKSSGLIAATHVSVEQVACFLAAKILVKSLSAYHIIMNKFGQENAAVHVLVSHAPSLVDKGRWKLTHSESNSPRILLHKHIQVEW